MKDPDSLWEALGFTEWNGPADILRNLGTGLAFAGLVAAATAGQGYLIAVSSAGVAGGNHVLYYFRKADDTETIKLFPLVEAVPAIGDLTVTNFQGCLKSHYGIKQKSDTVKSVETFGTFQMLEYLNITSQPYDLTMPKLQLFCNHNERNITKNLFLFWK